MFEKLTETAGTLWKAVTGDLTPEERKAMNAVVMKVGWRCGVTVCLAWAFGLLAPLGMTSGFARGDELDSKIAVQVTPLKKQLGELARGQKELSETVTQSLAEAKAGEIRYLRARSCRPIPDVAEREYIEKELQRKRNEYYRLTNESYDVSCAQVS